MNTHFLISPMVFFLSNKASWIYYLGQTPEEQAAKLSAPDGLVSPQLSLLVVDSYGEWTTLWESQFTALSIPHLRSHTLVHTDPLNKVHTRHTPHSNANVRFTDNVELLRSCSPPTARSAGVHPEDRSLSGASPPPGSGLYFGWKCVFQWHETRQKREEAAERHVIPEKEFVLQSAGNDTQRGLLQRSG